MLRVETMLCDSFLALHRPATARDAIRCMAELVEEYGYDQQFIDAIGPATGDRYKLNNVIERRER